MTNDLMTNNMGKYGCFKFIVPSSAFRHPIPYKVQKLLSNSKFARLLIRTFKHQFSVPAQ